jgi:hypothetical protein
MVLTIIIIIATFFITYDSIENILNVPFSPLGEAISYLLQIPYGATEGKYIFIALSPLPSLALLAGMMIKRKKCQPS